MQKSGAEILIDSLVGRGTRVLFGYPGGAIMPVYDALYGARNALRHVMARHEQGAVHAAQGFARMSGQPGVCLATSGPGATNLITGLVDALMDSTPLVCIVGQVRSDLLGTDAFQEADVIGLTLAATKWSHQVVEAAQIEEAVDRAFEVAQSGRPGPVLIELTRDAQLQRIDTAPVFQSVLPKEPVVQTLGASPALGAQNLARAAELINAAKRPYLLLGHGVTLSGAGPCARRVAERCAMPVACTLLGLDAFPTEHDLHVGMLGMHGSYAANRITNEADVILAVGMRFDDRVTGRVDRYAPDANIIHIDIDASAIGRLVPATIGVVADAASALSALLPLLNARATNAWSHRFRDFEAEEMAAVIAPECTPQDGPLRMGEVVRRISTLTHGQATIVSDVGQHQMAAARYYAFGDGARHITSGGLGTMGFGLPAALGAQLATAQQCVIAIVGDGGLQMTLQELATVVQEQVPLKIVVLNNQYLGMVRQWQELFFDGRYSSVEMPSPDFVTLCRGFGLKAERVDDRAALDTALARMLQSPSPYLLDVRVLRESNVFPMIPTGAGVAEMRLS